MSRAALESIDTELAVLGMMWDAALAPKLLPVVKPEYFSDPVHANVYRVLASVAAKGDEPSFEVVEAEVSRCGLSMRDVGGIDFLSDTMGMVTGVRDPKPHARILRDRWSARMLHEYCVRTQEYLEEGRAKDGGRKMADYLASKAFTLFGEQGAAAHRTRGELIDELIAEADMDTGPRGIDVPFQCLNDAFGPMSAGEVIGISAYSGGGKTTLACNLVNGMAKDGTPVIVFGTEMGKRWMARMAAVESVTSQWCAEKGAWVKQKDDGSWSGWPQGLDRYRAALERMRDWPLEVVVTPNITPSEVIVRAGVLRRKYEGHVVVVVDHMHRLDYGGVDPSKCVGQATRDFKNSALEDPDGLTYILLYQPRKPPDIDFVDRPVSYHQIRGDSLVGNELDVHISPFRYWVQCDEWYKTSWGTPAAKQDDNGMPILAEKPEDPINNRGVKLSDEHIFIANDKRRIGGTGKTHCIHIHAPSGRIREGNPVLQRNFWGDE